MVAIYCPQMVPLRNRAWTRAQDTKLKYLYGECHIDPAQLTHELGKGRIHIIGRLKQLGIYRWRENL